MLIVGERLNTSRKPVAEMVAARDESRIVGEAKRQVAAGADYIDVNAGTFVDEEAELLQWMCTVIQSEVNTPLCIDSSNPRAIEAALKVCEVDTMINSITGEQERFDAVASLAAEHGSAVIALCIDDSGMPKSAADGFRIGNHLVDRLTARGIDADKIYLDPLVRSLSTDTEAARIALDTIRQFSIELPHIHTICGLSNVGFGLPARLVLNRAFVVATIVSGMDSAILDPLDDTLMAQLHAAELIAGKDKHCKNYLKAYRAGTLK